MLPDRVSNPGPLTYESGVRKIIHELELEDYILVQVDTPWYNYYISTFFLQLLQKMVTFGISYARRLSPS